MFGVLGVRLYGVAAVGETGMVVGVVAVGLVEADPPCCCWRGGITPVRPL